MEAIKLSINFWFVTPLVFPSMAHGIAREKVRASEPASERENEERESESECVCVCVCVCVSERERERERRERDPHAHTEIVTTRSTGSTSSVRRSPS